MTARLIREANAGDADAVVALWTEAYFTEGEGGRDSPYARSDFDATAAAAAHLLVAEVDGSVAGVAALLGPREPSRAVACKGEAELARLVVSAAHRQQGIGRALADRCTMLAREHSWQAIVLWSRPYQTAGHRLYESLDYERVRERDSVDETGFGRLVFRLPIAPSLTARLEGSIVVLEPLREEHAEELREAAQAPEIWDWLAHLNERERFDAWMRLTLEAQAAGTEGAFTTRDARSGRAIGSSRFLNVRPADRVVEIGWTWLHPSAWRSGANVEAKLLMMRHAFETLGCVRVEFKTDARNQRSRAALAALPAQFEGVLRSHMIVPDVGLRDSAYFSVIESEWPEVRKNLERRLKQRS